MLNWRCCICYHFLIRSFSLFHGWKLALLLIAFCDWFRLSFSGLIGVMITEYVHPLYYFGRIRYVTHVVPRIYYDLQMPFELRMTKLFMSTRSIFHSTFGSNLFDMLLLNLEKKKFLFSSAVNIFENLFIMYLRFKIVSQ